MPKGKPLHPKSRAELFWAKVDKCGPDDCWEWTASRNGGGYGLFWNKSRRTMDVAHRVSYEMNVGTLPKDTAMGAVGTLVCHRCDNPPCVNPAHLFIGSQADNMHDRKTKGRNADHRGTRNPKCKLSDDQVAALRASFTGKHGDKMRIAREYGISSGYVSKLLANEFRGVA